MLIGSVKGCAMSEITSKSGRFEGGKDGDAAVARPATRLVHLLIGLSFSLIVYFSFARIAVLRQAELNRLA